jgi:hypothetical protein
MPTGSLMNRQDTVNGDYMKVMRRVLFLSAFVMLLTLCFFVGGVTDAGALSKEIAPDIPRQILDRLLPDSQIYITGKGTKEILLLADPFCENSRKVYRQLQNHLERIRSVRILWVSAFPEKGSEIVAAVAMKLQVSGKGESALDKVFSLEIPPTGKIEKARGNALIMVNENFKSELGEINLPGLSAELDGIRRNTDLAKEIGYTGTPHFIVDGRVLHGYSGPAIRILLKQ